MPDLTPKNAVYSRELDLERAREISERGLILMTTVGSVVHGLSNPGTDDRFVVATSRAAWDEAGRMSG